MERQCIVLVVDPDESVRRLISTSLTGKGHLVIRAATVDEARAATQLQCIDLALVDISLSGAQKTAGPRLCQELAEGHHIPVAALTTRNDAQEVRDVRVLGASTLLLKPFDERDVLELVARTLTTLSHVATIPA